MMWPIIKFNTSNRVLSQCLLVYEGGSLENDHFRETYVLGIKVNRKVQEEPQAEAATNPRHQEKEKTRHRLKCAWLTNKCTISTKTSSLFPKHGDQNAKMTEETHRQRAGQDQT